MKRIYLIMIVSFSTLLLGNSGFAQVNFRIGVEAFGRYKSSSKAEVVKLDQRGAIITEPLENSENSNLGVSMALEILGKVGFARFGMGVEYGLPRELKDSKGYFNFISLYVPAKIEFPLPFKPYLTGRFGTNLSRGDEKYKSSGYKGVSSYSFEGEAEFKFGFYFAGGVGVSVSERCFLEAVYSVNKEGRKQKTQAIEGLISHPHNFLASVKYSQISVSLGYRL